MVNGKLDEADSVRTWDILNRNVQRKDLGLLQQRDDVWVFQLNNFKELQLMKLFFITIYNLA